jgi:hypothetical protein
MPNPFAEKPILRQRIFLGWLGKIVEAPPAIGVQLELPIVHIAVRPAIAKPPGELVSYSRIRTL